MNLEEIADQLEVILASAVNESSDFDAPPQTYLILYNPRLDERWISVFLFESHDKHRLALESGICYWLHEYVLTAVSNSANLKNIDLYVSFHSGKLPESNDEHRTLHQEFVSQLDALKKEPQGSQIDVCGLCGHDFNEHKLIGQAADNAPPTKGWIVCPQKDCTCFRTWSANYGGYDA